MLNKIVWKLEWRLIEASLKQNLDLVWILKLLRPRHLSQNKDQDLEPANIKSLDQWLKMTYDVSNGMLNPAISYLLETKSKTLTMPNSSALETQDLGVAITRLIIHT